MRIVRTVARAVACTAFVPSLALAQAQSGGSFTDSWFWGIKGGASMFTVVDGASKKTAPSVGAEWLVTRTHIALNLSIEQAFFDAIAGVYDPTVAGSVRPVDIKDWRTYKGSILFFPKHYDSFHPYAGVGFAINVIQKAAPEGQFTSQSSQDAVFKQVSDYSSRSSVVFTGGAQYAVGRSSIFGQVTAMPTRTRFLISGSGYTFGFEAGLRYNVGNAIEKLK
ncbi:MAG: hypothetical protein U0163_15960 [Gemmatimonadaceae bacterium]